MSVRLAFGTAGIRAALGPGDDQINEDTVRAVAQALCTQLAAHGQDAAARGLCIGFDGRTDSDKFAREVARVALAHGFRVRGFAEPVPTPLLAFCTRTYGAAAGVMITASHNPPHENGIKLYLSGGAQLGAPHDRELAARLARYEPSELPPLPAADRLQLELLGAAEIERYLGAIEQLIAAPASGPLPRFAYSALCGVGGAISRQLFTRLGVRDLLEVGSQAEPRADFGGLMQPNPEHREALAALLSCMEDAGVDLGFAHDPDADRLAVVVREPTGGLRPLTGDEVGALLGGFVLDQADDPTHCALVSTLVSGSLLERITRARGAHFERTYTGFKWIAARGRALEHEAGVQFVFGYEEAIGYAFGQLGDDKDGIAALRMLLELVRRLGERGQTLTDQLAAHAREHGLFATRQLTLPRQPGSGVDLLASLRAARPEDVLGPGSDAIDYAQRPDGVDLLVLTRPNGARVCVRPSGTEPKLKLYLQVEVAVGGSVELARTEAEGELDRLEARMRALAGRR